MSMRIHEPVKFRGETEQDRHDKWEERSRIVERLRSHISGKRRDPFLPADLDSLEGVVSEEHLDRLRAAVRGRPDRFIGLDIDVVEETIPASWR